MFFKLIKKILNFKKVNILPGDQHREEFLTSLHPRRNPK